jgi:signal transduction histidine kinase
MRSRLRFAKRSSTRAGLLVGGVALAAIVAVVGLAIGSIVLAFGGLGAAIAAAAAFALYLIVTERRRHETAEVRLESLVADRERLSGQLVTAEQEERRRLALFLHDGPVQSMAGIALMLDAVQHAIDTGRPDDAKEVLASALDRHRDTIRSLRNLSFNIEPVVLRDQGFAPAVQALADQLGISNQIQIDLDLEAASELSEQAQIALYQIIRESLDQAIRRGPPTRVSIRVAPADGGAIETVIADDGAGERRRSSFDEIAERARAVSGRFTVEAGDDGGTAVRVTLPSYTAR